MGWVLPMASIIPPSWKFPVPHLHLHLEVEILLRISMLMCSNWISCLLSIPSSFSE